VAAVGAAAVLIIAVLIVVSQSGSSERSESTDDLLGGLTQEGTVLGDPGAETLLIEYGDAAALFTGDLPIGFEPGPMPDVDVLKVAHHGSNGSSSYMALFSASPSASVVSVGRGNSYGHPGEKLLERLAGTGTAIYRTDLRGAVTAELQRDGGVRVKTQLAPEG